MFDEIMILIPALNPGVNIVNVVKELNNKGFFKIIVVNDGSREEHQKYFDILKNDFNVKIYVHEKNLGKGQAIKTGIKNSLDENIIGVITVDADGQHLAKDVVNVAEQLKKSKNKIIFGIRNLKSKKVPIASKIGNYFSSIYLKLLTGISLKDTQTGLRAIPKKYFNEALMISGNRYDYEMNFLKRICLNKIEFESILIETVYENRVKNFRIVRDSLIVYKDFLKNLVSSIICSIIDVLFFAILVNNKNSIFLSNILARICSGGVDFFINKLWVYEKKSSGKFWSEMCKYLLLFVCQMILNSVLVTYLSLMFMNLIIIIKILINIILYLINFFIKGRYVFK